MMKKLFKNIKTTLLGSFTGLPVIIEGASRKDPILIITGLGLFLTGLFAKDADDKEQIHEENIEQ